MSLGRTITLNNGVTAPQIGFGTWQAKPGEVEAAVAAAIKIGYRHIDCALIYGNQNEVADGIKDAGKTREDLFLVSKLWNNSHRPERVEADLDKTLGQLRTDYLDAWLMHWPVPFQAGDALMPTSPDGKHRIVDNDAPSIVETWKEMVRIYKETKKLRAVGVSNMTVEQLEMCIKATPGTVPAMNQIEAHPQLIQPELFKFCKEKGIAITAYSPLGNNVTGKARVIDAPKVQEVAKRLDKQPAQVLIAWGSHQGFFVIPKSVSEHRIKANFEDFELNEEDFQEISDWGKQNKVRANTPAQYNPPWPINIFDEESEKSYKKVW